MTSLWPVVFSNRAAISFSGAAMPPPAMIWSSAAMDNGARQNVEAARTTALHAFILSPRHSYAAMLRPVYDFLTGTGNAASSGYRHRMHSLRSAQEVFFGKHERVVANETDTSG